MFDDKTKKILDYIMKIYIFILFILSTLNVFSQNVIYENYELKTSKSKYFAGETAYNMLVLQIINKTDSALVTWIEKDTVAHLTDKEKAKNYFMNRKGGDFYLAELHWEQFSNEIPVLLYYTFYKIIEPRGTFQIIILLDKFDDNIDKWIENYLVIVNENDVPLISNIKQSKRLKYLENTIMFHAKDIKGINYKK